MNKIVVLGSLNIDLVVTTSRMPVIGETIMGESMDYMIGGKGANQAVSCSRFGGDVKLLGKVGSDTFGNKIKKHLSKEKIDLTFLETENNVFTGLATIFKLPSDNCITILPGANDLVDTTYLNKHLDIISQADVLIAQMEIPIDTIKEAFAFAKLHDVITILNPAPYSERIIELINYVDYLTPNEIEFGELIKYNKSEQNNLFDRMLLWEKENHTKIIVTRGAAGVAYVENNQVISIPAISVDVVDTTGAGDTFNGVFATMLSENKSLSEAVECSAIAASLSTQFFGAQFGMPQRQDVFDRMKYNNHFQG